MAAHSSESYLFFSSTGSRRIYKWRWFLIIRILQHKSTGTNKMSYSQTQFTKSCHLPLPQLSFQIQSFLLLNISFLKYMSTLGITFSCSMFCLLMLILNSFVSSKMINNHQQNSLWWLVAAKTEFVLMKDYLFLGNKSLLIKLQGKWIWGETSDRFRFLRFSKSFRLLIIIYNG